MWSKIECLLPPFCSLFNPQIIWTNKTTDPLSSKQWIEEYHRWTFINTRFSFWWRRAGRQSASSFPWKPKIRHLQRDNRWHPLSLKIVRGRWPHPEYYWCSTISQNEFRMFFSLWALQVGSCGCWVYDAYLGLRREGLPMGNLRPLAYFRN